MGGAPALAGDNTACMEARGSTMSRARECTTTSPRLLRAASGPVVMPDKLACVPGGWLRMGARLV